MRRTRGRRVKRPNSMLQVKQTRIGDVTHRSTNR
nr:MAG TPA: hypothetical protein [Caudoviricetes sp.]